MDGLPQDMGEDDVSLHCDGRLKIGRSIGFFVAWVNTGLCCAGVH